MFLKHSFVTDPQLGGLCIADLDGEECGAELIDHLPDKAWWVYVVVDHPTWQELWVGPYLTEEAATHSLHDGLLVASLVEDTKAPYIVDDVYITPHPVNTSHVFDKRDPEEVWVLDPFNPEHEFNYPEEAFNG